MLEEHLGVRLLNRTTRHQSLTDAGRDFLERTRIVLAELESAEALAADSRARPPGVEDLAVGDQVSVVPCFMLGEYGLHGELVNAPARGVVKHPATLSWEEAAATWMMIVTAYGALVDIADTQRGDKP